MLQGGSAHDRARQGRSCKREGGVMRSASQIKFASKTIANQMDHFEPFGVVRRAFVRDDHLPGVAVRPHRNRYIRGPIANFLHLHPYGGLELSSRLGWLLHSALSWLRDGFSARGSVAPSQPSVAADHAGRLSVGILNTQFKDAGGCYPEYSAAVKAAIDRGYITMQASGGYLSFAQAGADLFA